MLFCTSIAIAATFTVVAFSSTFTKRACLFYEVVLFAYKPFSTSLTVLTNAGSLAIKTLPVFIMRAKNAGFSIISWRSVLLLNAICKEKRQGKQQNQ